MIAASIYRVVKRGYRLATYVNGLNFIVFAKIRNVNVDREMVVQVLVDCLAFKATWRIIETEGSELSGREMSHSAAQFAIVCKLSSIAGISTPTLLD
jgi:hypothetical protein